MIKTQPTIVTVTTLATLLGVRYHTPEYWIARDQLPRDSHGTCYSAAVAQTIIERQNASDPKCLVNRGQSERVW
jgi:hypothetical protein